MVSARKRRPGEGVAGSPLSRRKLDTSTWGKRLELRAGLNDPAIPAPFGPFTESPDALHLKRLVDVRVPTDLPGIASRDVTAYIVATQTYENNPDIIDPGPPAVKVVTPNANREPAFRALFGRLETGRGGISSFEDFIIPAHGKSIHIGADTVRLSVIFDPARVGYTGGGFLGQRAAGFSVIAGVATSDLLPDSVRDEYNLAASTTQVFQVPRFTRRVQFFSDCPDCFQFDWTRPPGTGAGFLPNTPSTGVPYASSPQPIPVEAFGVQITEKLPGQATTNPVLLWERQT
jgi:hypothetical protein